MQIEEAEGALDRPGGGAPGVSVQVGRDLELLPPGEGVVDGCALGGERDLTPSGARAAGHIDPVHRDPAGVGTGEGGDDPEERGLSIRAEQRRDAAQRAGAQRKAR